MRKLSLTLFLLSLYVLSIMAQDANIIQGYASETLNQWVNGWATQTIPFVGTPSCLLTFGAESYPVFQTNAQKCGTFGAAAKPGLGRLAVFGHNGYPTVSTALNDNVKTWLARGAFTNTQILNLNSLSESQLLSTNLSNYKFLTWTAAKDFPSPSSIDLLETYIRNGGGLLAAYPGWVLTSYNGFATANDFSMNKLLNRFGIVLTESYLSGAAPAPSTVPSVQDLNAFYAVQAGLTNVLQQNAIQHAVEVLTYEALSNVSLIFNYINDESSLLNYPIVNIGFKARIIAQFLAKKYFNVNNPKALTGIDIIPGVVTTPDRISAVVTVVREVTDSWISTGYYLNAGEILKITATTPIQNWQVRIGCNSDNIGAKPTWPRAPVITNQVKLTSTEMRITSPFGGLIYLVPSGTSCTTITVKLENVVEAPFFDLYNPNSVWNVNAPGPLAEIQGKFLTMTMPTKYVKNVTDPASIADFWDRILDGFFKLRGTPATRRERFVADIEISAGYMHSGYPIMSYLNVVTPGPKGELPGQLNVPGLTQTQAWGHFHEIGHNLQRSWWTFDGTGEVTNNIFSLLGGYICCGFSPLQNPWLKPKINSTLITLNSYILKTKDEAYTWYKSDPGVFLVQYAFIQNYFGWEAFGRAFASYEVATGPRPSVNQDKIDIWVKQLSIAVGKNLLPYYDMWRLPISDKGVADINALLVTWEPRFRNK